MKDLKTSNNFVFWMKDNSISIQFISIERQNASTKQKLSRGPDHFDRFGCNEMSWHGVSQDRNCLVVLSDEIITEDVPSTFNSSSVHI